MKQVDRRAFMTSTIGTALALAGPAGAWAQGPTRAGETRWHLLRNATSRIHYGGRTILLDPYLSDAGALPAFNNTPNPRRNPLVPLPMPARDVVAGIDAVLLTHTHVDHWDVPARELLPKGTPIFTQPADQARVREAGFTDVRSIDDTLTWEGLSVTRTGGQHGRGEVGTRMGTVSGYVLRHAGSPTLYIAGATIWCPDVEEALRRHRPDIVVVNAGEAQFLEGGPIIMGVADVVQVCRAAPAATVVAVHMEAVNHCVLSRAGLRAGLDAAAVRNRILIPGDGEQIALS